MSMIRTSHRRGALPSPPSLPSPPAAWKPMAAKGVHRIRSADVDVDVA